MNSKQAITLSIILVVVAEMFSLSDKRICLFLHTVNIFYSVFFATLRRFGELSLLLPVSSLRVVNLSMPILFPLTIYWIPLVYLSVLPSVYYAIRVLSLDSEKMGFRMVQWKILPLTFLLGSIFGYAEYELTGGRSLFQISKLTDFVVFLVVMYVFVALMEELIFRSILQSKLEDVFGKNIGLLLASVIFGVTHLSYLWLSFVFGVVVGLFFQKARDITAVTLIHGTANVLAYGLLSTGIALQVF